MVAHFSQHAVVPEEPWQSTRFSQTSREGERMPKTFDSFPVSLDMYTPTLKTITRSDFLYSVSKQMGDFLKIIPFMKGEGQDRTLYSKRFYSYVTTQAELAETLLDSCGAKENRAWFFLRELVAAARSLGRVLYLLRFFELHLSSSDIDEPELRDFLVITPTVRKIFDTILQKIFLQLEQEVVELGLTIPEKGVKSGDFPYFYIPGKLYADIRVNGSSKEEEAIVKIATSFLEIAEEYEALGFCRIFTPQELVELIPEHLNEERLRTFEAQVHNLQSVYDTYIQYTRMEAEDPRLPKLKGFVSIALHLLEIATVLVHFHERHERNSRQPDIYRRLQEITGTYQILDTMGNYALFYCTKFLEEGKRLSEETVTDYAQITSKRIPIPIYRGFHVRPSTYIAKIVRHYGVEVQMFMDEEIYDAGCVFDLFRANEKINMEKRRSIAKQLLNGHYVPATRKENLPQVLKQEIQSLFHEHAIVVHQDILPEDIAVSDLNKDVLSPEEVRGVLNELVTRLLALGKIDIIMSLSVTFVGDRRALHDIEMLAQTGYGEDMKGNNIPLPEQISYLYK